MNTNHITFAGFVATEPKHKDPGGRPLAEFLLAYNRKPAAEGEKGHTDFLTVKVWGRNAPTVYSSVKKGEPVIVCGPLRHERWTTTEGQERERYCLEAFIVGRQIVAPKEARA